MPHNFCLRKTPFKCKMFYVQIKQIIEEGKFEVNVYAIFILFKQD